MKFKHDNTTDRMLRKFGLQAYCLILAASILLTPLLGNLVEVPLQALSVIPALEALIYNSKFPARIAVWVVVSLVLYPVFHYSMRSRVYRNAAAPAAHLKLAATIFVMDFVLVAALAVDGYSNEMRRVGGAVFRLLTESLLGVAIVGTMLSLVYSLAAFLTIYFIGQGLLNLNKE